MLMPQPTRAPSVLHKLGVKYSFLNLFCRASETPTTGHGMPDSPYLLSSSGSMPSASPSPAPRTISLPTPPRSNLSLLLPSSPPESLPLANRHCPRMASDMNLGSSHDLWSEWRTVANMVKGVGIINYSSI